MFGLISFNGDYQKINNPEINFETLMLDDLYLNIPSFDYFVINDINNEFFEKIQNLQQSKKIELTNYVINVITKNGIRNANLGNVIVTINFPNHFGVMNVGSFHFIKKDKLKFEKSWSCCY